MAIHHHIDTSSDLIALYFSSTLQCVHHGSTAGVFQAQFFVVVVVVVVVIVVVVCYQGGM